MTEEKKAECVLRLFGVPDAAVKEAAGGFSPQWKAEARWKSRGAETLVALSAQNPAGLKKAAQALREKFSADLYGAGETTLAEAAVQELERHDRLLICSDAAAGTLLEARLETIAGAERVFDFGALSYAHPKTGAKIEQQAAAQRYGKVVDLAFPAIDPAADEAALDSLATVYADHILHLDPDAVLCQGECTFVYRVVQRLEAAGIPTLAACSRRKSQETTYPDGSTLKRSIFAFAGFRRYGSP